MGKQLLSGDKFNGNHQTYIKAATPLLRALKQSVNVKKIFLGEIKQKAGCGATTYALKTLENGVIEVTVNASGSLQLFRVVAKNVEVVDSIIASL